MTFRLYQILIVYIYGLILPNMFLQYFGERGLLFCAGFYLILVWSLLLGHTIRYQYQRHEIHPILRRECFIKLRQQQKKEKTT